MFDKTQVGNQELFNKEYGIVFAGGGAKGAYQAGAIRALTECGLTECIKFASGSSIGAINMCLLSQKKANLGWDLWKKIKPLDVIDIEEELIDGKEGFSSRKGLIELLNKSIDFSKIQFGDIVYYASLSEITGNGSEYLSTYMEINNLSKEDILNVILASSALPIIYEPVRIGNKLYKDGGLTDNLPVEPLYNRGVRDFIVVYLSDKKKINYSKYPNANFIEIRPSMDLGNLLDGTLNFNKNDINFRLNLGYFDTMRCLKYYDTDISRAKGFEDFISALESDDHKIIETNLMIEDNERRIQNRVNKMENIVKKYDINF